MKTRISDADLKASFNFAYRQATYIEAAMRRMPHAETQYQDLIPIDTSAPEWVEAVAHKTLDKFGEAGWIEGNTDDIPTVGIEVGDDSTKVYMAGVGYEWGFQEVNSARVHNINLPSEKAMVARQASEEMIDRIAMEGDAQKDFHGLLNYPGVTTAPVAVGNWATAPVDTVLAEFNGGLMGINQDTNYMRMADTALIPHETYEVLAQRRLGDNETTLLMYIEKHNVYTAKTKRSLNISTVRGLEKAGLGGVKRMITYRKSPEVLKMHMPMPFRFLAMREKGVMNYVVPGVFRTGGLDIWLPKEVRYTDGI